MGEKYTACFSNHLFFHLDFIAILKWWIATFKKLSQQFALRYCFSVELCHFKLIAHWPFVGGETIEEKKYYDLDDTLFYLKWHKRDFHLSATFRSFHENFNGPKLGNYTVASLKKHKKEEINYTMVNAIFSSSIISSCSSGRNASLMVWHILSGTKCCLTLNVKTKPTDSQNCHSNLGKQ